MKKGIAIITAVALLSLISAAAARRQDRQRLEKIEQSLKDDIPHILCIDESFATAGQPTDAAFSKLAANGFRSVLKDRSGRSEYRRRARDGREKQNALREHSSRFERAQT